LAALRRCGSDEVEVWISVLVTGIRASAWLRLLHLEEVTIETAMMAGTRKSSHGPK
jgi:hypothetical protein